MTLKYCPTLAILAFLSLATACSSAKSNETEPKKITPEKTKQTIIASTSPDNISNQQNSEVIVKKALGELALNYSQVYSYEQKFAGLEVSRMAGYIYEIYNRDIKNLDEDYCVDYFKASVWMIPISGGELNGLADTIAHECGEAFVNEMNEFMKFDEDNPPHYRKNYQPLLYERIAFTTSLVDSWVHGIKATENKK